MSLTARQAGGARILRIDRPSAKNAIDKALARALGEAVRRAGEDPSVRAVVLEAAPGETFLSGGDLREIRALLVSGAGGAAVLDVFEEDLSSLEAVDLPVIAAVSGDVFGGGCELVLLCDLVICEAQATFAFRHAKMGLCPAWGGAVRLEERAGPLEAARILMTAEPLSASEARTLGLANEVVGPGEAGPRALAVAGQIAKNAREAVATQKRILREAREARRGDARRRERACFEAAWGSPAHREAVEAFFARKGA